MENSLRQTSLCLPVFCATVAASCAAWGAPVPLPAPGESPPPREPATELPDILVTGDPQGAVSSPKYTEPLINVPQSITVVPQTVIQEQGATSLRDILRNVPGISIQAGEGGVPNGDNLSIRGFSARTDLFVDGVRDFGGYSRDPFNTEQVEVVKGPASTYSGRGSTGGSVNLSTKTPGLAASYDGTAGFGADGYQRFTIDLHQPIQASPVAGTSVRLNALWTEYDVADRDHVKNERWGVAPSVAFGLGTSTRVAVTYLHLDQDNMPDYGIPWVPANTNAVLAAYSEKVAPVADSNFYGLNARDYEKTVTDVPTATFDHDFSDQLSLRNLTRYGQTERDSVITAPRFVNANLGTAINRQLQSRDQTDTIFANQTYLSSEFDTGPVNHSLVAGVEYAYETSENFARAQNPLTATPVADLFNPDANQPFSGVIVRTGAKARAESDSLALSLFDTLKFGEKWQVSGGLRWDYFDVNYNSTATNGVVTPLSREDNMLSWRAGVVFKPLPNGSVYAAAGTSFNPSAEGLTLGNTANAANNINLDPEESRTIEAGTKWEFLGNRLAVSLAVFRTDKTNARTEDPADTGDVVVLDGEQRVQGVEVGVSGKVTEKWSVFGGYSFLDSEITESNNPLEVGNELSNTPENTFNLWTTYDLPLNFQVGGGAQFVDSRYSSNANTRQAPSYWYFDAMLGYQVSKNISLRLNVYNLTDEDYIDRVGGGHVVPGAGRTGMLTAYVDF